MKTEHRGLQKDCRTTKTINTGRSLAHTQKKIEHNQRVHTPKKLNKHSAKRNTRGSGDLTR